MRLLRPLLLLLALHVAGPALAGSPDDATAVTVLRGSSAPPPVAQQTVLRERTIVEYHYVPYETPVYFPASPFLAAPRIVRRHHN